MVEHSGSEEVSLFDFKNKRAKKSDPEQLGLGVEPPRAPMAMGQSSLVPSGEFRRVYKWDLVKVAASPELAAKVYRANHESPNLFAIRLSQSTWIPVLEFEANAGDEYEWSARCPGRPGSHRDRVLPVTDLSCLAYTKNREAWVRLGLNSVEAR